MVIARLPQEPHQLPGRFGPRPRTTDGLPFRQVDQYPPAEMARLLVELSLDLPHVRVRESRMGGPATLALALPDSIALGPEQAFIDSKEFCHIHAAPHRSVHLTLPAAEVEGIVALGWAERHPIHYLGVMRSLVLVYAPRTREEVDVVVTLIERSCRFAMGVEAAAQRAEAVAFRTL